MEGIGVKTIYIVRLLGPPTSVGVWRVLRMPPGVACLLIAQSLSNYSSIAVMLAQLLCSATMRLSP